MSTITWLDQSAEQNRQVRELVRLFSMTESRDELGIGQVRDVISDQLFPGTSVLHTRPRYALIVPWLFQLQPARFRGAELLARVQREERKLIEVLRSEGASRGLVGVQAGINVKILPSAIYWSALSTWGVLRSPVAADGLRSTVVGPFESDEVTERRPSEWVAMPEPPEGFPGSVPGALDLTADEATWLAERIEATQPGSLLAHLIRRPEPPAPDSSFPWLDDASSGAPDGAARWLEHASCFSIAMHGAALVYNLLLAEAYGDAGHTNVDVSPDDFREQLDDWSATVEGWPQLQRWDVGSFRDEVQQQNPRISPNTWAFVFAWVEATRSSGPGRSGRSGAALADDPDVRSLIAHRERFQKKAQSRLANPKQLERWSGAAGLTQLTFRWGVVRDLVTDIADGRARA